MKRWSCRKEQAAFLNWLIDQIDERDVQVLVVAGDIFHQASPSNRARQLYYRFLARCATGTDLVKAVVVAGNHDSPSGLEAPRSLLDELDVHVVGGGAANEEERKKWLCPVEGDSGQVELVVCAVPYVSEARIGLGHRLEEKETDLQRRFHNAFRDLYSEMADEARRRWPQARLLATGHLTCYGDDRNPQPGDYHTDLHRSGPADGSYAVGTIGAFPPEVFDEEFDYVALGHIHRCFPPAADDRRIWYSGTPVPTSRTELSPRRVVITDLDDGRESDDPPSVDLVEVPRWRQIHVLEGHTDELLEQLRDVEGDERFPPYVFVSATLGQDEDSSEPVERLEEAIDERYESDEAPVIVEVRLQRSTARNGVEDDDPPSLDEMSPMDVFLRLYEARHTEPEPPENVVGSFQKVLDEFHSSET